MAMNELDYLQYCKQLIEEELKWITSEKWKQRDYLHLIDLIENRTGISVSLSTIKRIWAKGSSGMPQMATLDALAGFLGYDNWLQFKEQHKDLALQKPKKNARILPVKALAFISGILLISLVVLFIIQRTTRQPQTGSLTYHPDDIGFTCAFSAESGVPNTVIFDYDVSEVDADSFFIQQSWDELQRERIHKTGKNLTSIYYYPGVHKAKLIANDSIIKQTEVQVFTDNWLAMARDGYMDAIPVYIRNRRLGQNGELHVTKEDLEVNGADLNQETLVSYYYVNDFVDVNSSDFTFKTRVRCDSILNITCPHITIAILGEDDMNFVPLTTKGCVGYVNVHMGDAMKNGRNADLSSFGVDIYQWQDIEVHVENRAASIYLNGELILELPFNKDIGKIVGFNINFTGSGAIDYISLRNKDQLTVYETGFGTAEEL